MAFHRLTWRIGAPFVLLVGALTLFLLWFIPRQLALQDTERFRRVATTIGVFVGTKGLPPTEELARDLARVTGHAVFARVHGQLLPRPPEPLRAFALQDQPADREVREHGGHQTIAIPTDGRGDFVLVREVDTAASGLLVAQLLAVVVLLLVLTASVVVRSVTRPLHNLRAMLPRIETDEPVDLPEARRADEIGDLARAFLRTRAALHDERTARERMEKLAVLGRMTAALAHEVQNPVAAIRMHAQLLHGAGHGADEAAATIEHEAGRIENLLNQWLFLTRPEPPALAPIDVGEWLAKVVTGTDAQCRHARAEVQLAAGSGLVVAADGRRLDQVFRNLLTNALQAMPGGGTLHIEARREPGGIAVHFRDSGRGFSAAALQRFAEFFFSEREGGMGIGLSVASEIVKAHGGTLTVANRAEGGACVTVHLPGLTLDPA
ncbi:MAG: HAMP domain-containing histidine kinase [Planctomycetes bacterium]|nr:HAMP domain-containing histidine kinase [Planctomycetota bacterium]